MKFPTRELCLSSQQHMQTAPEITLAVDLQNLDTYFGIQTLLRIPHKNLDWCSFQQSIDVSFPDKSTNSTRCKFRSKSSSKSTPRTSCSGVSPPESSPLEPSLPRQCRAPRSSWNVLCSPSLHMKTLFAWQLVAKAITRDRVYCRKLLLDRFPRSITACLLSTISFP